MKILEELFAAWEDDVQSTKEKLEGGGPIDYFKNKAGQAYTYVTSFGCSFTEFLAMVAFLSLFSFLQIGQTAYLVKQDFSQVRRQLERKTFSQILDRAFYLVPIFVQKVQTRVLSQFDLSQSAAFFGKVSTKVLGDLSKSFLTLVNDITRFNYSEYFTSERLQDLIAGDPVTVAIELANLRTVLNVVTQVSKDMGLYCYLVKLLLQQPPAIVFNVFRYAKNKLPFAQRSTIPVEVRNEIDQVREQREKMD